MPSPFLESVREDMRLRGYSLRTEKSYLSWIKRFILYSCKRHPSEMDGAEVRDFLTHLAVDRHVAINTQKIALNALVYLYQKHLQKDLGDLGFKLATKQRHLPTVLTVSEVKLILAQLEGRNRLIIDMLYGSGLRINECLRIRVQDIDLDHGGLLIHDGKGRKDRRTILSSRLRHSLSQAIDEAVALQASDAKQGGTICMIQWCDAIWRRQSRQPESESE
jgi:site-specific recombinase XerD